jgi:hypothetical protein
MRGGADVKATLFLKGAEVISLNLSSNTFSKGYTLKIHIKDPNLLSEGCGETINDKRDNGYNSVLRALFSNLGTVNYPDPNSEVMLGLADIKRRKLFKDSVQRHLPTNDMDDQLINANIIKNIESLFERSKDFVIEINITELGDGKLQFEVVNYPRLDDINSEPDESSPKVVINNRAEPFSGESKIKYYDTTWEIKFGEPKNRIFKVEVAGFDALKEKVTQLNNKKISYTQEGNTCKAVIE